MPVVRLVMLVCGAALLAAPLAAEAPSTSQRPAPRPVAAVAAVQAIAAAPLAGGLGQSLRPAPRPAMAGVAPTVTAAQPVSAGAVSQRPMPRPAFAAAAPAPAVPDAPDAPDAPATDVAAAAAAPAPRPERGGLFGLFGRERTRRDPAPATGHVCGDRDIAGVELAPITESTPGCGLAAPVRVTAVSGIRLSTPATIDCTTASALKSWLEKGLQPAFKRREIVEIRVAASYICRPRNNQRGNKISEHGRGKAIDISGIVFADGREVTVAQDYGRELRRAHKAACGIFGTTLGPGSDGYHEDHLHFDTARQGSGPYCR